MIVLPQVSSQEPSAQFQSLRLWAMNGDTLTVIQLKPEFQQQTAMTNQYSVLVMVLRFLYLPLHFVHSLVNVLARLSAQFHFVGMMTWSRMDSLPQTTPFTTLAKVAVMNLRRKFKDSQETSKEPPSQTSKLEHSTLSKLMLQTDGVPVQDQYHGLAAHVRTLKRLSISARE
jgi:hypothetical protein